MRTEGDYDNWNIYKKYLCKNNKVFLFKETEVWWCSIGLNVGTEIFGKGELFTRPVLIIKKLSNDTCICIPLTSKKKIGNWFCPIVLNNRQSWCLLNQIRMVHATRFNKKLGQLPKNSFNQIKQKLRDLLEL